MQPRVGYMSAQVFIGWLSSETLWINCNVRNLNPRPFYGNETWVKGSSCLSSEMSFACFDLNPVRGSF